ncbi:MAG: glycosyltransferase family 1 protein [Marinicaulis sp.]|nr:glycosyltransferase family 1 protein [Marinicaulis sp.]
MTPLNATEEPTAPTRKLRIALFSGNYNYVMDGPVRALNMLVAYLEKQGHEVLVFAPTSKEPAFEHNGTLISAPSIALPGRSEYRFSFGVSSNIKARLKSFKPDLIHLSAPDLLGYTALRYARKNQIPAVASFHTRFDTYPRYYGASWLEKYLTNYMRHFYQRCEHVYPPSQSMADELRADGIGHDIRLWTRGVDSVMFNPGKRDLEWRRSIGFEDKDVVIAFVGRIVLEKGIDVFVEAIGRAKGVKALVVGEGPERARFADKLPAGHFTGYQQGEDLARAYASADVFFNPSITETFGNVTLEAMASGTPALCAKAAGSLSLVEHEMTGLLAEPTSAGFASALERLAGDETLRRRLGERARERSLDYSWNTILGQLVGNYYEAIDNYQPNQQKKP